MNIQSNNSETHCASEHKHLSIGLTLWITAL